MKMFQYITIDSKGFIEEIWACENCRKKNSIQILKGKWRLIDKCEKADFQCDSCRTMQAGTEQPVLSEKQPEGKTPLF